MLNENRYTSLALSKKLAEGGCKVESDACWVDGELIKISDLSHSDDCDSDCYFCGHWCWSANFVRKIINKERSFPAYDLFWDIAQRGDDFFDPDSVRIYPSPDGLFPGDDINELIWQYCKFNPENQALKSDDPEGEPVRVDIWKSESTNLKATLEKEKEPVEKWTCWWCSDVFFHEPTFDLKGRNFCCQECKEFSPKKEKHNA